MPTLEYSSLNVCWTSHTPLPTTSYRPTLRYATLLHATTLVIVMRCARRRWRAAKQKQKHYHANLGVGFTAEYTFMRLARGVGCGGVNAICGEGGEAAGAEGDDE